MSDELKEFEKEHEEHEHHHHEHDEHEHHHHHHDGDCCCGHDHDHDHEGHEQHHEEKKEAPPCTSKAPMRIYIVENLDCANCAAKIERKIQSLPGVEYASLTFATKQLRVAAKNQDELFPKMVAACSSIEPDAKIIPREETKKKDDREEKSIFWRKRKNAVQDRALARSGWCADHGSTGCRRIRYIVLLR